MFGEPGKAFEPAVATGGVSRSLIFGQIVWPKLASDTEMPGTPAAVPDC